MAIDKVTPQKLNSSVDARYRSNTDMSDALNINFGEDHKSNSADSTSGGDLGVLKPTPSNTVLEGSVLSSNSRVIGSVTDDVLGVIFFFVWAANADEMGVWAYDRDGVLPNSSADSYVKVFTSSRFGFPALGFVDGDVVHIGQKYSSDSRDIQDPIYSDSSDKSCVLYFTDNINEPRKLDVYRAMTSDLNNYGVYDINDLIKACPRTPLEPITFEFSVDPERQISNFEKIPGMQFAYQLMYRGGVDSPISTYSKLAIPEEYLQQGTQTLSNLSANVCVLTVPSVSSMAPSVKNITEEVEKIRLLVRFGNAGGWKVIEELKPNKITSGYLFHNDRILYPVSEEETAMHFSGLPRKARSQAIVSNRLLYANYLEGFDSVECDATGTPVYIEAATSSSELNVVVRPFIMQPVNYEPGTFEQQVQAPLDPPNIPKQKVAGYKIDTGGIPFGVLAADSIINIQWGVSPEQNYHLYDFKNSYHGNRQVGDATPGFEFADDTIIGYNTENPEYLAHTSEYHPVSEIPSDALENKLFGLNSGVGYNFDAAAAEPGELFSNTILPNEWVSFDPETGVEISTEEVHGTSAATPLIIKGGALNFNLRFKTNWDTTEGSTRSLIKDAIYFFMSGGSEGFIETQDDSDGNLIPFATELSSKSTSEYSFNLQGPTPGNSQEWVYDANASGRHDLICSVGERKINLAPSELNPSNQDYDDLLSNNVPIGHFAITKGTVNIGLTSMKSSMRIRYPNLRDTDDVYLALEVLSLEDTEISTCIPVIENRHDIGVNANFNFQPTFIQNELLHIRLKHWDVYHQEDINGELAESYESVLEGGGELQQWSNLFFISDENLEEEINVTEPGGNQQLANNPAYGLNTGVNRRKAVGFFRVNSSIASSEEPRILLNATEFKDYKILEHEIGLGQTPTDEFAERFKFSLLDGKSIKATHGYAVFLGQMWYPDIEFDGTVTSGNGTKSLGAYYGIDGDPGAFYSLNITKQHSWVEIINSSSFIGIGGDVTEYSSFKTYANHDFGIVYYDERGRSSLANFLDSVYVGGYSDSDPFRDGKKGRVQIAMQLNHNPPSWAHSYQIAYGGNSSVEDFIQYTSGPAFIDVSSATEGGITTDEGIIYVSLANLQGANSVSYSDAWGAVNKDGGKSFYTYSEGDKLRIISYLDPEDAEGTSPNYPSNYEFEVIGVKTMTSSTTENFFHDAATDSGPVHPSKIGEFLVLKNNPLAVNFSYGDIVESFNNEEFNGSTIENFWNNQTVVEIYSPKKIQDIESRLYYQIGKKYNITQASAGSIPVHQTNPILIQDGDVYWRRVPLNLPRNEAGRFLPLLETDNNQPRFRTRFLETNTFTDLFAGANGKNYGKPKIMFSTATEARNRSSVTFSERNNYSSRFNSFTRFNPTILPFKDLPNEYGAIQSLVNEYDSILVIQENKISSIPVERNILATAGGSTSLIASGKVLGTQRFYAGDYGCDTNPESVTRAGTSVYFASKKRKEVYMYSPNQGVAVVSDAGMKTFFYSLFSNAMANADTLGVVRVVGGYDPLKDEFLLSVINNADPNLASGGGGMITIEGGDLGDVIPINLSVSGEYGGTIEDIVYDDGGDTSAIEISALEAELAVANSTVEDLIALVNEISSDLIEATSDLGELQIFFNDLLGDAANEALYSTGLETATLPNGETVNYSTYSQFVNAVSNEIVAAEALIDDLNDKIVDTNFEIGLLYDSFISNTNNFVSLTESYQTVLLELDLTAESTVIDLFLGEIANNIPETDTIQMTYSNGNVVTITVTDELNNFWMGAINISTSQINTLFQGIPQGPTGFAELVTTAIQNLDTTNANLISAFRNFIESITSVRKQDQALLFNNDEIGDSLATFLNGTGLDGLDVNNDGVFTNTELDAIPSVSNTTTKFQNTLDNYINGLTVVNTNLSNFINDLLAVADEETYNYVDQSGSPIILDADNAQTAGIGFANYINFLEGKLTLAQGDASAATTSLEEANESLSDLRGEVVAAWNAAVADGSLTYNEIAGGGATIEEFNDTILTNLTASSEASHAEVITLLSQTIVVESSLNVLQNALLFSGYAPTTTENLASLQTGQKAGTLIQSVQSAMNVLKGFQQMFAEEIGGNQFGKTGSFKLDNEGNEVAVETREVLAASVLGLDNLQSIENLGVQALQGVKNAIDSIQLALESSGSAPENAPASYLSPAILDLFPEGGGTTITTIAENLNQYIQANGITMAEYASFRKSAGRLGGLDGPIWNAISSDANADGSANVTDLLGLLAAFGESYTLTDTIYEYDTDENGDFLTDEDGNFILIEKQTND